MSATRSEPHPNTPACLIHLQRREWHGAPQRGVELVNASHVHTLHAHVDHSTQVPRPASIRRCLEAELQQRGSEACQDDARRLLRAPPPQHPPASLTARPVPSASAREDSALAALIKVRLAAGKEAAARSQANAPACLGRISGSLDLQQGAAVMKRLGQLCYAPLGLQGTVLGGLTYCIAGAVGRGFSGSCVYIYIYIYIYTLIIIIIIIILIIISSTREDLHGAFSRRRSLPRRLKARRAARVRRMGRALFCLLSFFKHVY